MAFTAPRASQAAEPGRAAVSGADLRELVGAVCKATHRLVRSQMVWFRDDADYKVCASYMYACTQCLGTLLPNLDVPRMRNLCCNVCSLHTAADCCLLFGHHLVPNTAVHAHGVRAPYNSRDPAHTQSATSLSVSAPRYNHKTCGPTALNHSGLMWARRVAPTAWWPPYWLIYR